MDTDHDTQIKALISELDSDDMDRRWQAAERLKTFGTEVIDPLLQVMRTQTGFKCWEAVQVLGHFQDPRLIEPLKEALESSNPLMSSTAAKALEKYGEVTLPYVLEALPRCTLMTQLLIVGMLERGRVSEAVGSLVKILSETPESSLRYTIIQALGTLAQPGTMEVIDLIRAFEADPDHHVRKRVQAALNRLGASASKPDAAHSETA